MMNRKKGVTSKTQKDEEFRAQFTVMKCEMPDDLREKAMKETANAFETCTLEKDIAGAIKREFERENKNTWNCIVGKHFAVSITHSAKYLIFLQYKGYNILLFKTDE